MHQTGRRVDQPVTERRVHARFPPPRRGEPRATLRPGCPVRLVDLSAGGALLEASRPLRPGARVHLQLVTAARTFALAARSSQRSSNSSAPR